MLESVFVILFAMGFVTFLLSLFDEWETLLSFIMSFISILFFLSAWAGSVYIQVPPSSHYYEPALGWICFGLIIVNLVGTIVSVMNVTVKFKKPRY